MKHNRNRDNDRRRGGQDFRDIIRQIDGASRPRRVGVPPMAHPDFMPDVLVKAISMSAPAMRGDGDAVTIPRSEYEGLLASKVTLGLLMKAAETETLSRYNIADVIAMLSNGGKGKGDGATADA